MEKTPINRFKKLYAVENATPYNIPGSPLMKKLGYGTGVAVYLMKKEVDKTNSARKAKISSPWAIKKCLKGKTDKRFSERLVAEAEILRTLSHPNIVGFRAFTKSEDGR